MTPDLDPILTVTLNPALDLSARIDVLVAGPKLRLEAPVWEPGGGGVNVARAIRELGGSARAWVALAGASGAQHLALMEREGLAVHVFDAPGETRATWAITDAQGQQFRLQLPGPDWSAELGPAALADIVAQARGLVVLSGSQPPGLSASFVQDLARTLGAGRLVVDTSGAALRRLVEYPATDAQPFLLRLDQAESEGLAGQALSALGDSLAFALALVARGVAETVCLARGAEGSVLAGRDGTAWHCRPPEVRVASKVGAGDSFTGAFVLALARRAPLHEALQLGTAAAAAAVMTEGTALCRNSDVQRLVPQCVLHALAS